MTPKIRELIEAMGRALFPPVSFVSFDQTGRRSHQKFTAFVAGAEAHAKLTGWQPIESALKDGTEFQAWVNGWEPKCRFNPESEAFEIYGRVDCDEDGWVPYYLECATHWMPIPELPEVNP